MKALRYMTIAAAAVGLTFAAAANATVINSQAQGLTAPAYLIDFTGQAEGTDLSNAYSAQGVTFTNLNSTNVYGSTLAPAVAPSAVNFDPGTFSNMKPVFSLSFAQAITDISFYLVTDGYGATITSYLNGQQVETFSLPMNVSLSGYYQGFTNTLIDTVTLSIAGDGAALLDNIGYNPGAVPEPASVMLLGLGMVGLLAARRKS